MTLALKMMSANPFQVMLVGTSFSDIVPRDRWTIIGKDIEEAYNNPNRTFSTVAEISTRSCENAVELYAVATFIGKKMAEEERDPIQRILNALTKR